MAHVARLTVDEEPGGGWRVALSDPFTPAVVGRLPGDVVDLLSERGTALQRRRPPRVLTPGQETPWSNDEARFGQALASALAALPELWAALHQHIGRASTDELLLFVEASGDGPRRLPWELLAASPNDLPLEIARRVCVARAGPSGWARLVLAGRRLRLVVWAPDPDHDTLSRALRAREALAAEQGLRLVLARGPLGELPPPEPGEVDVLDLLCHGAVSAEAVTLLVSSHSLPPGDPVHALAERVRESALTLLEVCESASALVEHRDSLAGALVGVGGAAVLAPSQRIAEDASNALIGALLTRLSRGESLLSATRAGRAAMSGLARAHPWYRWWMVQLALGRLDAGGPLIRRGIASRLAVADDLADLLEAAEALARQHEHGFVGLEHLAGALLEGRARSPLGHRVRALLAPQRLDHERPLGALELQREPDEDLPLSPRLARHLQRLPPGAAPDDLWLALGADRFSPLLGLEGLSPGPRGEETATCGAEGGTLRRPPLARLDPPDAIEIIGGPEDGRLIELPVNATLGRSNSEAGPGDLQLYQGTALTDPRLARTALKRSGLAELTLKRAATRSRGGEPEPVGPGVVVVAAGDVLALTEATRIGLFKRGDD